MAQKWYEAQGQDKDVVVSTRARLARNIKGRPFETALDAKGQQKVLDDCKKALLEGGFHLPLTFAAMADLSPREKRAMVERHLISPVLEKTDHRAGILYSEDEGMSVVLNEEDHIRIQAMASGLAINQVLDSANRLDDMLAEQMDFAFDSRLGYLTACPTNLGTGLRLSVMLHLPAMTRTGHVKSMMDTVASMGYTVRGAYGEGTRAEGYLYQVSNQHTLGLSEEEIAQGLTQVVQQIIDQERQERRQLMEQDPLAMEDQVYRSLAAVTSARIMSGKECASHLSNLRLGIGLGLIHQDVALIDRLEVETSPANLMEHTGAQSPRERDAKRAELLRSSLQ
jgi:protein arginine kinase